MAKKRADVVLYEQGLVNSREKAKRIIMSGSVFIGTIRIDKPGEQIDEGSEITIKNNPIKYVSRGGLKLEKAIASFNLILEDKVSMDIGASTGGFTDCMLAFGASKVYAVDVGYGQLDWSLRNDPRVVVMERTNIRNIKKSDIGEGIDFISIDVSFISLKLVLPVAADLIKDSGEIVALIKPQFEAGKDKVGKKGIIRDKNIHLEVIQHVLEYIKDLGLVANFLNYSPIKGATGNIEFLVLISKTGSFVEEDVAREVIEKAHNSL